jgi:hypothetical protein
MRHYRFSENILRDNFLDLEPPLADNIIELISSYMIEGYEVLLALQAYFQVGKSLLLNSYLTPFQVYSKKRILEVADQMASEA